MPVINGVYLKDFPALPSSVTDANIIPIAISGNQIAYRTTVAGIVTDARVTSKLLTGLSVTGSTILATDTILQAFGKVQNQLNGKVSSVGLTMPSAFNVANSPITSAGTLAVTAAGVASQYIRGDGALGDFPTTGGGGSSVSYYLNGSVSQGTIGGNTYYEMNKTPVIGTGTDFSIAADGYIAQFITDANDPASLLIPGGNWNVEMYFSASSSGGTPSFYVEVYKYDGTAFTLLGSSSATPEGITNGTAIDIYYTSVGIPETVLTITDRLAIRVYVTHSGRTITLHTEDNHLSEIVTTFSNGLTALNGLTKQTQYFATGTTGTDFNISSSVDTHTFNIPSASATARGLITTGTQTLAGTKTFNDNISVSTSTANSAIQATSTKADGRALSVLATSSLEPFAVVQNGAGKLAAFSNTSGEKFIIYNSGSFEANGATLYANLDGTTATFTGLLTGATATFSGTSGDIIASTATTGKALRGTATTGYGLYASVTSGQAVYAESTGTGGSAINGTAANGIGGYFINNATSFATLIVTNSGSGNLASFSNSAGTKFTINNAGNLGNGTYTYTLPSATGTLALTSALSSYLPLSGGTLTGALSGTSATFSGEGSFSGGVSGVGLSVINTTNARVIQMGYSSGVAYNYIQVYDGTSFQPLVLNNALTLASTGAATFSSSVTAGGTGNIGLILRQGSATDRFKLFVGSGSPYIADDNYISSLNTDLHFLAGASGTTEIVTFKSGGNVGIGLTNPDAKLFVKGSGGAQLLIDYQGTPTNYYDADTHIFRSYSSNTYPERMRITSGGNVGIGTTDLTSVRLRVKSTTTGSSNFVLYTEDSGTNILFWVRDDGLISTGARTNSPYNYAATGRSMIVESTGYMGYLVSTRESKSNIESIKSVDFINKLNPVQFNYRKKDNVTNAFTDEVYDNITYGFIADEVEKVDKNLVFYNEDGITLSGVEYNNMIALLVKSVQELKAEIDLLKGEPIIPTNNNLE
jgi:hypothetical protein